MTATYKLLKVEDLTVIRSSPKMGNGRFSSQKCEKLFQGGI